MHRVMKTIHRMQHIQCKPVMYTFTFICSYKMYFYYKYFFNTVTVTESELWVFVTMLRIPVLYTGISR